MTLAGPVGTVQTNPSESEIQFCTRALASFLALDFPTARVPSSPHASCVGPTFLLFLFFVLLLSGTRLIQSAVDGTHAPTGARRPRGVHTGGTDACTQHTYKPQASSGAEVRGSRCITGRSAARRATRRRIERQARGRVFAFFFFFFY